VLHPSAYSWDYCFSFNALGYYGKDNWDVVIFRVFNFIVFLLKLVDGDFILSCYFL